MKGDLDAFLVEDRLVEIVVEIDDLDAGILRRLQAGQEVGRIDRGGDHRHRLALEHRVAEVELGLGRLVALRRLQEVFHAGLLGAVRDALGHRAPERIGQRLHQYAVFAVLGLSRADCGKRKCCAQCQGKSIHLREKRCHSILRCCLRRMPWPGPAPSSVVDNGAIVGLLPRNAGRCLASQRIPASTPRKVRAAPLAGPPLLRSCETKTPSHCWRSRAPVAPRRR